MAEFGEVSLSIEAIIASLDDKEQYICSSAIQSKLYKLKKTLSKIQHLLNDSSQKELTDQDFGGGWLIDLQHLCYELDDVLDDAATEVMDRKLVQESKSITRKVTQKLPSLENQKLVSITNKLDDLANRAPFLGLTMKVEKPKSSRRIYESSLLQSSNVIGRRREKKMLLKKLLRDEPSNENFSIVPIVGPGGIGKTALARVLYNDSQVRDHFELMAWVCVHYEFDVFKISKTIFQSLTNVNKEFGDLDQLQMALVEQLKGKRFLLVVDDVWTESYVDWELLVRPFHMGAHGIRIIMTTRQENIFRWLRFNHINHLQSLPFEDALSLLALHALGVYNFDSHATLRSQGEGIVIKCGGLPLALTAVGSLLRTKIDGQDWYDVLNNKIWNLEDAREIVPAALRLSYHYLPSHLKWLFAYCSLFPKNFLFDKEDLVFLWLAEGFLNQSPANKFNKSPERMGHDYFETLLSRSFFQHASDHKSLFVMHDLMHDLAKFVAGDRFSRFGNQIYVSDLVKWRHLSFIPDKYVGYLHVKALKKAKSLRTFLALPVGVDKKWNFYLPSKILGDLLLHLPLLRVLNLSNCNICEVPDSIGTLRHLRYLNLSQTKIKELPNSIGNLYYLQTLVVFGCQKLTNLPKSFLKLKNLRHLDIRVTPLLKMPLGIGELKSLRTLSKIIIGDNGFAITKLKELNNLCGELSIEGLHTVQKARHARKAGLFLKRLTKLALKWDNVFDGSRKGTLEKDVLNELRPYSDTLKELAIVSYGGMKFPNWVGDPSFRLLVDVSIIDCRNCTSLPPLGSLHLLNKLLIKGMHQIKVIDLEFGGTVVIDFPKLEILEFEDMLGWELWSNRGKGLNAAFPCLRKLQIKNCPRLTGISLEAMPSLRVLQIGGCDSGVLRRLVKAAASITKLEIKCLSGLNDVVWRSVIKYLGAVKEVSIWECDELRYLWESEAEASMALVNLEKLEVFRCSNLISLGEKEDDNRGSAYLTCLRNLEIWFCESMMHCSCPHGTKSLTIGSCNSITHISFPSGERKLKSLSLHGCHRLMEMINNKRMPMLEFVYIGRWSNLRSITELGVCIHLTYLKIQDCQSLESFPDLVLPYLTHLTIEDCQRLVSFPDLVLPYLTHLTIEDCQRLVSFPDLVFPRLTHLTIEDCQRLVSLPGVILSRYPSLIKHLKITNCSSIGASFPCRVWPPSLCSLEIGGLSKPILEWGPQKFSASLVCLKLFGEHVSDFNQLSALLPSSLTELHIQEFNELKSLATGLEHLTSLQQLGIHNCPEMMHLPEMLPPSLLTLEIFKCPNLERRCDGKDSHYWPLISHIPCVDIQDWYSFVK